jgi:hypothetical protein
MEIGMLWYDGDPKRSLDAKVASAVEYYKTKYGSAPTVCVVHPSMLAAGETPRQDSAASRRERSKGREVAPKDLSALGVQLRTAPTILINHFWLGIGETGNGAEPKHENGKHSKKTRRTSAT